MNQIHLQLNLDKLKNTGILLPTPEESDLAMQILTCAGCFHKNGDIPFPYRKNRWSDYEKEETCINIKLYGGRTGGRIEHGNIRSHEEKGFTRFISTTYFLKEQQIYENTIGSVEAYFRSQSKKEKNNANHRPILLP